MNAIQKKLNRYALNKALAGTHFQRRSTNFEKAISLLKENSGLSFINPTLFLSSDYGQGLREFLTQYKVSRIVDFGDLPIFEEAITYTGIFFISKSKPENISRSIFNYN